MTSLSVTTLRTSSSEATIDSLTHAGSAQPTFSTDPSEIQKLQYSCKQVRQKTCEHESWIQRAPLTDVRHNEQGCEFWENSLLLAFPL